MQCGGRPPGPGQDTPHVDIYNEKAVRLATKVLVPTKQHPKVRPGTIVIENLMNTFKIFQVSTS